MSRKKETLADLTEDMRHALIACAGQGVHPREFTSTGRWSQATQRALTDHGLIHVAKSRKGRDLWRATDIGRGVVSADEPPDRRRSQHALPKWARSRDLLKPRAAEVIQYWRDVLPEPRFVYFIQEEGEGAIKIGQALEPLKRLAGLQCGNPRKLMVEAVVLAGTDTETALHNHWRPAAGIRSEWFGKGHEPDILVTAQRIATAQIESHRQGESFEAIVKVVLLRALFAQGSLA